MRLPAPCFPFWSHVMRKSDHTQALDVLSSGSIGLNLPKNLSFEDWRDIGRQIGRASSRLQWQIGDWWIYGEHRYGERRALIEADIWDGPAFQTCMNWASVCRAFPTSRRREVLTFGHHEAA